MGCKACAKAAARYYRTHYSAYRKARKLRNTDEETQTSKSKAKIKAKARAKAKAKAKAKAPKIMQVVDLNKTENDGPISTKMETIETKAPVVNKTKKTKKKTKAKKAKKPKKAKASAKEKVTTKKVTTKKVMTKKVMTKK